MNILLKDLKNKLIQGMLHLKEDTEIHITENINILNENGADLQIESLEKNEIEYWTKEGFEVDNSLYDRLIIEQIHF